MNANPAPHAVLHTGPFEGHFFGDGLKFLQGLTSNY